VVDITASPESLSVGQTITFDGSESYAPYGTIVGYHWTLPGQAFCISGVNASIAKCKFNAPGTYTVWLTVEDDQGEIVTGDYTITISAATNSVWYVRPDGNDDNDGSGATAAGAFKTIQTAIDSASDGDEIRVFGGVYYGELGLKGKAISIYSYNPENTGFRELAENAIIDANKQGTTVMFDGSEPNSCQIKGFTMRGGFPTGDSLALYLEFDDPNTIALDSSGKERNGIVSGYPNRVAGYDSLSNGALEFSGNDSIQISDYKGVAGKHPRSCAMWIKTTAASTDMVLMSWGKEAAGQKWQLLISDSNEIALDVENGRVSGTTTINDGNWHHVAAVFEGNGTINIRDIKLYIDGVQEATSCSNYMTTLPDVNTELDGDVCLGASGGAVPRYYRGTMDEVRIYSRALRPGEIQQMAEAAGPAAHWTMDAISGNTISDSSSHARTGTFSTVTPTSTCSDGRIDNAIFLQNNEYIEIEDWTGITGIRSRSCSGWIRTSQAQAQLFSWGQLETGKKWIVRLNETGELRAEVQNGYIIGTTVLTDNKWHHIAVVLDSDGTPNISEVQLYVDGVRETIKSVLACAINTSNANNVQLGAYSLAPLYYTGWLDDMRIYDRPLREQEILEMAGDVGLMAHWNLDETAGTTSADNSGNGIHGTWQGSPQLSAEGYFAGAVEFDGMDDYISTSYTGVLGNRDRTVCAWIKAASDNSLTLRSIVSWGTGANGSIWNFSVSTDSKYGAQGALRLGTYNAHVIGSTPINDNRWHHVAAVFANKGSFRISDVCLYVDGKREVLSNTLSGSVNTIQGDVVKIGTCSNVWFFKGKIDEVRIYDRALSEVELRQMYEETIGCGITGHGTRASIQQCIITDNISAGNGGGIDFLNGFISQCDIINNRAEGDGGGLWGGNGSLISSRIAGNQSLRGGGIFNYSAQAMIDRCLFESNCAKQTGGAIYNVMSDLVFKSCSFYGNSDLGLVPVFPNASLLSVLPDWFWETSFGGNGQYIEQDLSVVSLNYPGQTGGTEYQIRWGQVANNVTENKSGLGFTGYAPPIRTIIVNEPFEIGRLRHFNNPVGAGSPPSRVDIEIALALECGSQLSQSFTFSLAINETANTSNLSDPAAKNWADRDFITFPVSYPSQLIEIEGRLYTLKIIGFQTEQGQLVSQFESPEHGTNTVYLWAQIVPPPADGAITNLASNIWVGNCVFVGNTSCSYGAALSNWACDNVFVGNSTITANHGEFCGGIYNHESNLTLVNSILWGNTDVDGLSVADKQLFSSGNGTISVTYSCIQDANSCDTTVYPGTGNIDNAPLFLISPTDGGDGWGIGNNDEYGNLYLSENSPCIDAGTNAPVLTYTILTDIFGHVRRFDCPTTTDTGSGTAPIVDMGAYEYGNNAAPVAVQDQASTSEGTAVVIDVLANDSDVDGDAISIDSISSGPSHGTAVISGNTIVYTPAPGYFGSDAFNYRITDGVLVSNDAAVSIQITSNHVYVNAGPNQTIQLPNNKVYLDGVIQGLPSGSSPAWRVLSQPTGGAVSFDSSVSVMPAEYDAWDSWASFSLPGMYVLELGVAIAGQEYKDQVVVNVRPGVSGNLPPQVEAWATPSEITLPQGTTLNWTISDDGISKGELTQEWSVVSGPLGGEVTLGVYSMWSRSTSALFSLAGTYTLQLIVSDGIEQTVSLVLVQVNPDSQANMPPIVDAGPNRQISLIAGQQTLTLDDPAIMAEDVDNRPSPLLIKWTILGETTGIGFTSNSNILHPTVTVIKPGCYVLQLEANDGLITVRDSMLISTSSVLVNAGPDEVIVLPDGGQVTHKLSGFCQSEPAGLYTSSDWQILTQPQNGEVLFSPALPAEMAWDPNVTFTVPGDYVFRLSAKDASGVQVGSDDVYIKVKPASQAFTTYLYLYAPPSGANLVFSSYEEGTKLVWQSVDPNGIISQMKDVFPSDPNDPNLLSIDDANPMEQGRYVYVDAKDGVYKVTSGNNKFSVLAGDVYGESIEYNLGYDHTSGYFVMGKNGLGVDTEFYSHIHGFRNQGRRWNIFAYHEDTHVTVHYEYLDNGDGIVGELDPILMMQKYNPATQAYEDARMDGFKLSAGEHVSLVPFGRTFWIEVNKKDILVWDIDPIYIHITADKPVSVEMCNDSGFYVPSSEGLWTGKHFNAFIDAYMWDENSTGVLSITSFDDETKVSMYWFSRNWTNCLSG
jgi:hypothetical protein